MDSAVEKTKEEASPFKMDLGPNTANLINKITKQSESSETANSAEKDANSSRFSQAASGGTEPRKINDASRKAAAYPSYEDLIINAAALSRLGQGSLEVSPGLNEYLRKTKSRESTGLGFNLSEELQKKSQNALELVSKNCSIDDSQKERLSKNIARFNGNTDISYSYKQTLNESLSLFAKRADLSAEQKGETLKHLNLLLESNSDRVFSSTQKAELAAQMIWHLANKENNSQGSRPNCQLTALRGRLLYEAPFEFAHMMTEVITTGQFVAKDKSVIKPDLKSFAIDAFAEESVFPPRDGTRTWLGKISDLTMANIYWQRQAKAPNGDAVKIGQISYREDSAPGTGRLVKEIFPGKMETLFDSRKELIDDPHISANAMADLYRQIVGTEKKDIVLAYERDEIGTGDGVALVSEKQLHEILSRGGVNIAQISTDVDWIKKDIHSKAYSQALIDGEHVVIVRDYDPISRTLAIDNSWQACNDRIDTDRRISLHELYEAMSKGRSGLSFGGRKYTESKNHLFDQVTLLGPVAYQFPQLRGGLASGYGFYRGYHDLKQLSKCETLGEYGRTSLGLASDSLLAGAGLAFLTKRIPMRYKAPAALAGVLLRSSVDMAEVYYGR